MPESPYGVAKKAAGDYLNYYRAIRGLEYSALAMANVYGPRQNPHGEAGVVSIFAGKLLSHERPVIYGDGSQTRDFVYVDDVVDAFVRAVDKGGGLLMNIGTGVETSVQQLFDVMAKLTGFKQHARATTRRARVSWRAARSIRAGPAFTSAGNRGPRSRRASPAPSSTSRARSRALASAVAP